MPWHEALYFAASSFTPFVGVGDSRVAVTTCGKLVVFVMVIISIVAIPVQTAQLYSAPPQPLPPDSTRPGARFHSGKSIACSALMTRS